MIVQRKGQDVGINSRGIHLSRMNQADGPLVPSGLNDSSEIVSVLVHLDQTVAGDAGAGVRVRFVESPRATAQIGERAEGAIAAHDHVREVDGPAAVAAAA